MNKRTAIALLLFRANVGESRADDEGCTVFLCLSNPAGWANIGACVVPVQKMFANLRKGGSLACNIAGASTSGMTYSQGKKPSQRWIAWTDSAGVRQLLHY